MTSQRRSQNSNMLLAFLTLLGVIALVALVGFFMLRKGPEIIQGQAEATEIRISGKLPGRIDTFFVQEGDWVHQGDTLVVINSPEAATISVTSLFITKACLTASSFPQYG